MAYKDNCFIAEISYMTRAGAQIMTCELLDIGALCQILEAGPRWENISELRVYRRASSKNRANRDIGR